MINYEQSKVKTIKAIANPSVLKRVVGYARVSTADEHQDSSYRLQINELEKSIRINPRYEFIGVFKDRKSGRDIKHREEFTTMIELASMGEIDVIVTKSITRFGRNLLETINIIRSLKLNNVEVIFQKENISTFDPSIEMVLSILAMHAEEESNNISQNTLWSIKRKKQKGGNLTTSLYGYEIKGESWKIVPSEAKAIRIIFEMYIAKKSYKAIISKLHDCKILSPSGKEYWVIGGIEEILRNEKYAGHMNLGKTYIHNGTRIRSSRVEMEDNRILNHHNPIVSPDTFDKAMDLRKSRTKNTKDTYVPFLESVSPYYQFVYSVTNNNYMRYRVEKPKGKYEIPTLYCYDKMGSNRERITVNNLFIIMNKALNELSISLFNGYSFSNTIDELLEKYETDLLLEEIDKTKLLKQRAVLSEAKSTLPNFTRKVKNFKQIEDIVIFRSLVRNVSIEQDGKIRINLNLIKENLVHRVILESSVQLRIGNGNKTINYYVSY